MTRARYLVGDVFDRLAEIPDGSVDLVMTSPPFLALRSYLPADHPDKAKEIGSEATPADFLDTLLALTAEWGRVLAPHGSICVELGDTYAGSGGAGGDYNPNGLRDGQPKFRQLPHSVGPHPTPLEKSLLLIPGLYAASLAYGRNLLTGQPSPAGQWRIRNLVAWVRPNPPVGALGDKFRPATSYLTIACRARDRWFDLDAVRTSYSPNTVWTRYNLSDYEQFREGTGRNDGGKKFTTGMNPAGAPPLDWWNHVDMLIDDEIAQRAKHPPTHSRGNGTKARSGKSAADERGGNWASLDEVGELAFDAKGATGSHIRRRLEAAGYLGGPTDDVWDIAPSGYAGAHFAVYPPELCVRPILAMCPRRVCTTCGQPSRRLGQQAGFGRQPELAAHIKERRETLGITSAEVNSWFGYKEIAKNWERTDQFGARIPDARDWPVLKDRLGLSDDFDDFVMSRDPRVVEYEHVSDHPSGRTQDATGRVYQKLNARKDRLPTLAWSDCGHNTWRAGHVLDPFAGTGTTLAVATGHGREATGIDLDPRNAVLAQKRLGMFLDIHDNPTTEPAA